MRTSFPTEIDYVRERTACLSVWCEVLHRTVITGSVAIQSSFVGPFQGTDGTGAALDGFVINPNRLVKSLPFFYNDALSWSPSRRLEQHTQRGHTTIQRLHPILHGTPMRASVDENCLPIGVQVTLHQYSTTGPWTLDAVLSDPISTHQRVAYHAWHARLNPEAPWDTPRTTTCAIS